jgi:hypothetical protein
MAELNGWVAGIDLSGGIDAQIALGLQGSGGNSTITGSNLANGSVSEWHCQP